ncbi:MAG: hypothetical protein NZ740_06730 [Kiritimatiellae bacterium]|nr:hypothetical protein [Kiritimatiellia bacterium]MDW8458792.1 hypothetical protein [Verrucomicrobiota bacterium]
MHIRRRIPRRRPIRDSRRTASILAVVAVCAVTVVLQIFWTARNTHKFAPFSLERISCDACAGLGVVSVPKPEGGRRLEMCPACYGVGARQVRRFDEFDRLCPACAGTGRVENEDGTWRWCERCGGRGLIRLDGAPPPEYKPPQFLFRRTEAEEYAPSSDGPPAGESAFEGL